MLSARLTENPDISLCAIEAGLRAGRPRDIAVTHFGDQRARGVREAPLTGHAVVALSPGPGMSVVLEEAGAFVVYSPPGHRPTSGDLLTAVQKQHLLGW